jgi:hypothetical protein
MKKNPDDKKRPANDLDAALQQSVDEMRYLASFYHQRGHAQKAQEIYQTIFELKKKLSKEDDEENAS